MENRIALLTGYLLDAMEAVGKARVDGVEIKVNVQRHNPGVVINDYGAVPDDFLRRRTITEVDKDKAAAALKEGMQCNWCRFGNDKHIVIR